MTTMVAVDGLSKRFGHLLAVDDISLTVARGEVLGFLGPNGSGKSTTMKMLTGFLTPSAGSAEICGISVSTNAIEAQRHLGYLPEGAPAYADITTSTFLRFIADVRGLRGTRGQRAIGHAVDRTNIAHVLHQPIETLSKGYRRRVGLAQALLHNPDVLILDEPTDGLDPNQKHEVRALIREMSQDKAIIISTHILEEVETVCTRALIIADGRIVADGTPHEFERRSRYYNAVSLTLPPAQSDVVRAELETLSDIAAVEAGGPGGESEELIAFADNGRDILSTIAPMARQRGWPIEQLQLKRGHLDEVFRSVTTGNTGENEAPAQSPSREAPATVQGSTLLRDVWTICRRELIGYFSTPIAYVFIVIFLAAVGAFTFFLGGFFARGQATLEGFFQFHPWLYLFLIPAIAMRLWAEERKSGSIELLLTLPVTTSSAVLGKFLAAWAVAGLGLLLTATLWITVNYLGSPDNAAIAAGYAGSFFMAGGYLAIGAFVSAMTRNQIVAFIITAALCFLFTASGLGVVIEFFSGWAPRPVLDTVANFSFLDHFRDVARGVVDLRDVVFFVSTIVFFLFANIVAVEHRKDA